LSGGWEEFGFVGWGEFFGFLFEFGLGFGRGFRAGCRQEELHALADVVVRDGRIVNDRGDAVAVANSLLGFLRGFRGLVEERRIKLDKAALAGILTVGGTILGTSRDKPHRMLIDGRTRDMTDVIVKNYHKYELECLVCLGGGGTQKSALRLHQAGLNVITLPKTIDNDVAMTDSTFGFATALDIATEAIDRLHSTAHSHHRIIIAEIMGNNAGWLTLGAGIAGGADVILIPEIPYNVEKIADAIKRRSRHSANFSIVAVAEGAMSVDDARAFADEPVARDYFFNLEGSARWQSHRARLAVKLVVRFVGRQNLPVRFDARAGAAILIYSVPKF